MLAGGADRALATVFTLLMTNLLGLGLGPLVVGLIADRLSSAFGAEALRYATMTAAAGGGPRRELP